MAAEDKSEWGVNEPSESASRSFLVEAIVLAGREGREAGRIRLPCLPWSLFEKVLRKQVGLT